MKRITTKQASIMMGVSEQAVRVMIQNGRIPGASCGGSKTRHSYFITDAQIKTLMEGGIANDEGLPLCNGSSADVNRR